MSEQIEGRAGTHVSERRISQQKQAQIDARAEIAYTQGLWYAWGRIDSGTYNVCIHCGEAPESYRGCSRLGRHERLHLNAFDFAQGVKTNQMDFDSERTHFNESIQGQWDKFVAAERAAS